MGKPPRSGVVKGLDGVSRCWWCSGDALYERYHDHEWGRPQLDDTRLFEKICLEGFQAGLSWLTILRKRENFRRAFKGFDIAVVARFNSRSVDRLMSDPGIVRNRAKIEATINNARRAIELVEERGTLADHLWSFRPERRRSPFKTWTSLSQLTTSPEAIALSKDLRKRGWAFVGPTTIYSFMESVGMVNDHLTGCSVFDEVERLQLDLSGGNE